MLQQQTAAARLAANQGGPATAAPAAAGATAGGAGTDTTAGTSSSEDAISVGEVDVMAGASEPVSAESTEDLQPGGGVLQVGCSGWGTG